MELQYKYTLLYLDRKTKGTFISYQQSFAVFCIRTHCAIQAPLCKKKLPLNDILNSLQSCINRETIKAEFKVHLYSGWTTSRTDTMCSDWKQTFTHLNGTEARNVVEPTVQGKHILQCIEQALSFHCTRQRRKGNAVTLCMWSDLSPEHIVRYCSPSNEDKHALEQSGVSLPYSIDLYHNHININTNKDKQLLSWLSYAAILGKALFSTDTREFRWLRC